MSGIELRETPDCFVKRKQKLAANASCGLGFRPFYFDAKCYKKAMENL
jgi:hypothetical protein